MSEEQVYKLGGVAAILGVIILLGATLLHPSGAHPADALAAFAEYATSQFWVVAHLGQFVGVILIVGGLISLSWRLHRGGSSAWAALGTMGALVSLSVAGALQAVDGVALKVMVDRLSNVAPELQAAIFEAAFAVRQVEIGLASMFSLLMGLTVVLYAGALLSSKEGPNWLGWLGLAGGVATMASGIIQAHTGFSDLAMTASMPSSVLLMLWTVLAGVHLLRRSRKKIAEA